MTPNSPAGSEDDTDDGDSNDAPIDSASSNTDTSTGTESSDDPTNRSADAGSDRAGTTESSTVLNEGVERAVAAETTDSGARGREESMVSTDELFEVLASPANRYVLTYLLGVDNPVTYGDLVQYVVEHVDSPDEMTTGKFRGHVAAALINETLPQLEAAGLVSVDSQGQTVSTTPATATAAPHLALALSSLTNPRVGSRE
jgi:hypothetical protein